MERNRQHPADDSQQMERTSESPTPERSREPTPERREPGDMPAHERPLADSAPLGASKDGVWYPVLQLPHPPTGPATVLPASTRVLEFPARLVEHVRTVLQHLRRQGQRTVLLIPEDQYTALCATTESSTEPTAPEHAVLAQVLDYDAFQIQGSEDHAYLSPLRVGREQWLEHDEPIGDEAAAAEASTTDDSSTTDSPNTDESESPTSRVQTVRTVVKALCRAKYDPTRDVALARILQQAASRSYDFDFDLDGSAPSTEHSPTIGARTNLEVAQEAVTLIRVPITLDPPDAASISIASQPSEVPPSVPPTISQPDSTTANDTMAQTLSTVGLLIQRYNRLAMHHPQWSARITPLSPELRNAAEATTALEQMADQLLTDNEPERLKWLELENIHARANFLSEVVHRCDSAAAAAAAEPAAPLAPEAMVERRRQYWTPAWEKMADTPDSDESTFERDKFERQKYFRELPQLCDRRHQPPQSSATLLHALDQRLYGMAQAKRRVVQHLRRHAFSRARNAQGKARFIEPLCLVGPPGVGKTSFAQAVAAVTGKRLVSLNMPEVDGALDLHGSKVQWKAPTVGYVIEKMHEAGECDPVFLLDEIDKLRRGSGNHVVGDPTGVLLQLFDPLRVSDFTDKLLDQPYPILSQVLFIATANDEGEIYPALRNRMRIIRLPGYSDEDKFAIARNHLIPAEEEQLGLREGQVILSDEVLQHLIHSYSAGPGIRTLQQALSSIYDSAQEQLEQPRGRSGLQPPICISLEYATAVLEQSGKEAFWSDAWTDKLSNLPKEDAVRHRYLINLPQPCDIEPLPDIGPERAQALMDESHYGLDAVKQHVLDYLSVLRRCGAHRCQPLCLVGPRGVGKTSFAKIIAKTIGRPMELISIGGKHDEPVLRGTSWAPGGILQAMLRAARFNPVIILDEIDKIKIGRGGNDAALLEILDPEQNTKFEDQFLREPYDLSGVLFVATANCLEEIPLELQDRFHVIQLPDYTPAEKRKIADDHLRPRVLQEIGLTPEQLTFSDEALDTLLEIYEDRVGVRGLHKGIREVVTRVGHRLDGPDAPATVRVTAEDVIDVLGPPNRNPKIL